MTKPYYDDGNGIVIYHGDCYEILPQLASAADLLLTDPPYGIYACGGKWGKKQELTWDKQPAQGIGEIVSLAKWSCVWGGNYFSLPPSRGWLVWHKRDAVPSASPVELAWTNLDMNSQIIEQTIAATNAERVGHPTQKPLRVMSWCLKFFPNAGSVIDPFLGSGTTLRAAKDAGLKAVGIEIEERYCEIAANRLAQGVFDF